MKPKDYGFIGIIGGSIVVFFFSKLMIEVINKIISSSISYQFELSINPVFLIISLLFLLYVIYLSCLIPAEKVAKVSPMEAIRDIDDMNLKEKQLKSNSMWFGIEEKIAKKSIKRNKKLYRIIKLSIIVTISIIIISSSFNKYVSEIMETIDKYDFDINFYADNTNKKETETVNEILKLPEMEEVSKVKLCYLDCRISNIYGLNDIFLEGTDRGRNTEVQLIGLPENEYNDYLDLVDGKKGDFIILNHALIENDVLNKKVITKIFDNMDNVSFDVYLNGYMHDYLDDGNVSTRLIEEDVKVCELNGNFKFTDKTLITQKNLKYDSLIYIYTNYEKFDNVVKNIIEGLKNFDDYSDKQKDIQELEKSMNIETFYIKTSNIPVSLEKIEKIGLNYGINIHTVTPKIYLENILNFVKILKIIIYGIVGLIIIIGAINLFNTIDTSIEQRKREFAILRSIGLTKKSFNKILFLEHFFVMLKAFIIFSLIGIFIAFKMVNITMKFGYVIFPVKEVIFTFGVTILLVLLTSIYTSNKIKKSNIMDCLKFD